MRFRSVIPGISATCLALVLVIGPIAGQAMAADPYVVRTGDTLSLIAARESTTVGELVALNHLGNPDHIVPGERLVLPAAPPARPAASRTVFHVVLAGEHLTGIAAHYGTTIARIVAANHLADANLIFAGQRLRITGATRGLPASTSSGSRSGNRGAPRASTRTYRVRPGDTLTAIATRFGATIGQLVALNGLANPGFIQAGQPLLVPVSSGAARATWTIANFDPATQASMSRHMAVARLIASEAHRSGVPVRFALAVAWQESGWRQDVVSSAGAIGVMQLLPATGEWVADAMLGVPIDVGVTGDNVRAGVVLLRHYLDRYDGNEQTALAAYYQGQRATDAEGIFSISRPYIASILLLEAQFRP